MRPEARADHPARPAAIGRERRAMKLLRGFGASGWPRRSVLASLAVTGLVALAACGGGTPKTSSSQNSNDLTVWVDSVRLPAAQAYVKDHPNMHVNVVTFD